MIAIEKMHPYNSNIFDPYSKETPFAQAFSWIVVIATSILSLGIVPGIALARTAWRKYHNIVEPNKTIDAISNVFRKRVHKGPSKGIQSIHLTSPSLKSSSISSLSITPRAGFSPQLIIEEPFLRILTWKLFPHQQMILSHEEMQASAATLKEKITGLHLRDNEYVLDPAEVFTKSGDEPIKQSINLILDFLLLTGNIGMYAKICDITSTEDTVRYLITTNPEITTSNRTCLDRVDTANRDFLEKLDKYMFPKAQKMDECRELNSELSGEHFSLLFCELIRCNYLDFKQQLRHDCQMEH